MPGEGSRRLSIYTRGTRRLVVLHSGMYMRLIYAQEGRPSSGLDNGGTDIQRRLGWHNQEPVTSINHQQKQCKPSPLLKKDMSPTYAN